MPTRTRVFLLAALVFVVGAAAAAATGIPSGMAVSTAFVAAATWAYGPKVGLLVLVAEQFVAVPVLASIQAPGGPPPLVILVPVVLNDCLMLVAVAALRRAEQKHAATEVALRDKNTELETALAEVKELRGILPICAWCKSVRDVNGIWDKLEAYLSKHSHATLTHGICPPCLMKMTAGLGNLPKPG
jgi:hypothetical protein